MIECPVDQRRLLLILNTSEDGERCVTRAYRCQCGYRQIMLPLSQAVSPESIQRKIKTKPAPTSEQIKAGTKPKAPGKVRIGK